MSGDTSIPWCDSPATGQEIRLVGDVNVLVAEQFHREAVDLVRTRKDVGIECREVGSVDVSALQVLVALSDALASQGGRITLRNPPRELEDVLGLTGLEGRFLRCRDPVGPPPNESEVT
ncbi:MAG: STAS domain-containing protein [Pirellulales bacterium]|nr:STAS domain-containing protein [Pirellulales bacterium]